MSWFSHLQSLITFRKNGSGDLVVPQLDGAGRIRVSILSESPIEISATPPAIVDGSVLWYKTPENNLYYYNGSSWVLQVSSENHKILRQLNHLADVGGPYEGFASGAYREMLPAADPFPTSIIWWESVAKLKKIVEKQISYTSGKATPSPIVYKVYDTDGVTVLATVTDTIAYSGPFELSRVRVVT